MTADWQQRVFDVLVSLAAFILLLPILAVITTMLLIAQGPPVIYRETRIGIHGRPFVIYKFRTMLANADQLASVATRDDPRLTTLGRYLKPSRLDELPQLINTLRGDMSLVGPRPLPPSHLAALPAAVSRRLLTVRPGITSPASIRFIAEDDVLAEIPDAERTYLESILPAKVKMQNEWLGNRSLLRDVHVLFDTVTLAWSPGVWQRSRDMIRALIASTRRQ